jgi:hypothetical protein
MMLAMAATTLKPPGPSRGKKTRRRNATIWQAAPTPNMSRRYRPSPSGMKISTTNTSVVKNQRLCRATSAAWLSSPIVLRK